MLGIGQADKRQLFNMPIIRQCFLDFRPNSDDFRLPFRELFIVLAQLRHVLPAMLSKETAIENQDNMLFPLEVGKLDHIAFCIVRRKIRCHVGLSHFYHCTHPLHTFMINNIIIAERNVMDNIPSSGLIRYISGKDRVI